MSNRPKVLVMHALRPTSRQTTIDHLLSFREHLPHCDVQYLHFQQPIPKELQDVSPDLFIINYDFLNYRFTPLWPYIKNRYRNIARQSSKVVAIAQDDFWANKLLDNWCMDWDVDRILTPITNDLDVLYPRSIKHKEFRTALTGYVKSGPVPVTKTLRERPIDLGQRVREMPPHLGRLAQAKARQAVAMADAASDAGFVVDVSTRVEDSFIGTAWFDFLASCKFTVGMKGGASLHDSYGLIHTKVQSYVARHPQATFDEIERACFKGKDMKHEFTAISPRLFEAAMAGTCQILQREDYLGVLEPWRDYIPLERDLSNIDEVLDVMKDLDRCQEIVVNAKRALIDSQIFDYSELVKTTTSELVASYAESSFGWRAVTEYLARSSAAVSVSGLEIHDASLHLIYEELLNLSSDVQDAVKNVLIMANNIDVSSIKSPQVSISETGKIVLKTVVRSGLSHWFIEQLELLTSDQLSMRTVWTWRTL